MSMRERQFFVYLLASQKNGTLYLGVTSDLPKRIWQHKNKLVDGFTEKHDVDKLVWFEECADAESAILREKQLKMWKRAWKIRLIEIDNPEWLDLYDSIIGVEPQQTPGLRLARIGSDIGHSRLSQTPSQE